VSVGTYWAWQPTATLPSAGAAVGLAARGASAPTEGGEGRRYIVAATRLKLIIIISSSIVGSVSDTLTVRVWHEADRTSTARDAGADSDARVRDAVRPSLQEGDHLRRREDLRYAGTGLFHLVADARRVASVRHAALAQAPDRKAGRR